MACRRILISMWGNIELIKNKQECYSMPGYQKRPRSKRGVYYSRPIRPEQEPCAEKRGHCTECVNDTGHNYSFFLQFKCVRQLRDVPSRFLMHEIRHRYEIFGVHLRQSIDGPRDVLTLRLIVEVCRPVTFGDNKTPAL